MGFVDDVKLWAERTKTFRNQLQTEEGVKHSLVMPFLQILGYNVFDPNEVVPEFTADLGLKKGEKVDYAIFKDSIPHILIEVKSCNSNIDCHTGQLYRYFGVTKAKFGILTNGIVYQFFSDLDEQNKMDTKPFLILDLDNLKDQAILEVDKFHKKKYNIDIILSTANELKYSNQIKDFLGKQLKDPDEDFARLIMKNIYDGKLTHTIIQRFDPLIKKTISIFISELVSDKLKLALEDTSKQQAISNPPDPVQDTSSQQKAIVTNEEELEAFVTIRYILRPYLDANHTISYKDTLSYFSIILDNRPHKWICRLFLTPTQKSILFRNGEKTKLNTISELDRLHDQLRFNLNELLSLANND